jgi:hypothetical protein
MIPHKNSKDTQRKKHTTYKNPYGWIEKRRKYLMCSHNTIIQNQKKTSTSEYGL